ncbi:hypothetical protein M23134_06371 [Microscilla marina ATCC 23134]|uniref:Uncharacterized protein n=1 Tax=Microscilla marina ATCC 23134 TaxID=313606 RepID=A1ZU52_MICM2|nr:hypothetical protein M23134_06371 [Microscilla marina ATCC 23134]
MQQEQFRGVYNGTTRLECPTTKALQGCFNMILKRNDK